MIMAHDSTTVKNYVGHQDQEWKNRDVKTKTVDYYILSENVCISQFLLWWCYVTNNPHTSIGL